MPPFKQPQQILEGNFYVLCTAFRPRATQTHLVLAKLEKSHLTDASVKTRGYFSNAIEPMVGGSAFTKMSLARIATASSFVTASVLEKQCSMYSRKHGRKCWGKKKKVKSQRLASLFNHHQIHKKTHYTNHREIQMLTNKPAKHQTYQFWCP